MGRTRVWTHASTRAQRLKNVDVQPASHVISLSSILDVESRMERMLGTWGFSDGWQSNMLFTAELRVQEATFSLLKHVCGEAGIQEDSSHIWGGEM